MLCNDTKNKTNSHKYIQSIVFFLLFFILIFLVLIFFLIIFIVFVLVVILQIDNRILLILILSNQIAHILIRLLKLHLIHAFALIPMQKRLTLIHFGKLCANPLKYSLYCRRIGNKCPANLTAFWRNSNNTSLHIVRYPRHKIIGHLLLHFGNLIINFLCGNLSAISARSRQIFAIFALHIRQKVSGTKHLIRQFLNIQFDLCTDTVFVCLERILRKQWCLCQEKEM